MISDFINNIFYNLIYYYSKCQLFYYIHIHSDLVHIYNTVFTLFWNTNEKELSTIEILDNGKMINKEAVNQNQILLDTFSHYDLIIYTHYHTSMNKTNINKILFYHDKKIPSKSISFQDYKYDISNIKFMDISLIYNDITYPLNLSTSTANYYIVNNKLNTLFFRYYLINVLFIPISELEELKYKLNIIDNNINILQLCEKDTILILKEEYKIIDKLE
jgi:hypothetical protein